MGSALARHVTLRELSGLMGWSTSRSALRRLRKRLEDRQRVTPAQFLQKLGTGPNSPVVTTVPLIRRHCPEMVDKDAELDGALNRVAEVMRGLRTELDQLKKENHTLKARERDLREKVANLEQRLKAA